MRLIKAWLSSDGRVLLLVIVLAALSQGVMAMRHSVEDLTSPNGATWIGRSLVERGVYESGWWTRLRGPSASGEPDNLRMFHLPGEPLYTAAGLVILPKVMWRFMHVPVTTLLIACAAWWGMRLGGRVMGLLTGLIGMFHPFVLVHGVVWDDTFTGAALDWLGATIVLMVLLRGHGKMGWGAWAAIFVVSGYTAITRAASQIVLGLLAVGLLFFRSLRPARSAGIAMLMGVAIAIGCWGLRNRAVSGEFFLGSTHDGITLWESVYPSAIESLLKTGLEERMNNERMQDDFAKTRNMGELEANTYFIHRAHDYILGHPWEVARTGAIKLGVAASGLNFDEPKWSARNIASLLSNGLMILLAVPAFWRGKLWKQSDAAVRTWFVTVLTVQMVTTVFVLFMGPTSLRYWVSVQPFLWMGDAWTVMWIVTRMARHHLMRA